MEHMVLRLEDYLIEEMLAKIAQEVWDKLMEHIGPENFDPYAYPTNDLELFVDMKIALRPILQDYVVGKNLWGIELKGDPNNMVKELIQAASEEVLGYPIREDEDQQLFRSLKHAIKAVLERPFIVVHQSLKT
ncbi:MAG: hypothetical protein HY731_15225 [Candidatus Tectomicrobia bacterium]|nr:hypothetical protein [Candidatus Tectomicrobia bacterium]